MLFPLLWHVTYVLCLQDSTKLLIVMRLTWVTDSWRPTAGRLSWQRGHQQQILLHSELDSIQLDGLVCHQKVCWMAWRACYTTTVPESNTDASCKTRDVDVLPLCNWLMVTFVCSHCPVCSNIKVVNNGHTVQVVSQLRATAEAWGLHSCDPLGGAAAAGKGLFRVTCQRNSAGTVCSGSQGAALDTTAGSAASADAWHLRPGAKRHKDTIL